MAKEIKKTKEFLIVRIKMTHIVKSLFSENQES